MRLPWLRKTTAETPLVTAVVNNYNYARFLHNAIGSVLRQTYSNIEATDRKIPPHHASEAPAQAFRTSPGGGTTGPSRRRPRP